MTQNTLPDSLILEMDIILPLVKAWQEQTGMVILSRDEYDRLMVAANATSDGIKILIPKKRNSLDEI